MLCYMAITPAVRQRPVRLGLGGLKAADSRHRRPVPPFTLSADVDEVEEEKKKEQGRRREITNYMNRNPGYFHLIPSFQ